MLELGMQRFDLNAEGDVLSAGKPLAWWQQAGSPPPERLFRSMKGTMTRERIRTVCDVEAALVLGPDLVIGCGIERQRLIIGDHLPIYHEPVWIDSDALGLTLDAEAIGLSISTQAKECPLHMATALLLMLDKPTAKVRAALKDVAAAAIRQRVGDAIPV
jgi:hypothetical protein